MRYYSAPCVEHSPQLLAILCACSALLLSAPSITAASVRGVPPELVLKYDTNADVFKCLDGSKSLLTSRVNDDYCDCLDGSDEPGTSACSNGRFYCRNKGHQPLLLNASFVDDGICDCCDGSDEQQGCKNTCKAAGSAARQDLESKTKEYAAGAKSRHKYVSQSQANKAQWKTRLEKVTKDLTQQQGVTDKVKAAKEEAEQADKERREAAEALKKEEDAAKGISGDGEVIKPEETVNTGSQHVLQEDADPEAEALKDPLAATIAAEVAADDASQAEGQGTSDSPIQPQDTVDTGTQHVIKEEAEKEEELTPDEIGRKIASQWTTDPDAAGSGRELDQEEEEQPDEEEEESEDSMTEDHDGGDSLNENVAKAPSDLSSDDAETRLSDSLSMESIAARAAAYWDMSKDWLNDKVGGNLLGAKTLIGKDATSGDLTALTDKFVKANGRLHELQKQQTELQAKLANDYGLEEAFGALVDKCYEAQVDKYTYSVCPFKDAFQKEGSGKTSLGTWAGLTDDSTVMKFTNGQACWQGPPRSMTVSVRCGSTEKLLKVEEPSRCEYVATLLTPAACTPIEVQAIQDKLSALDQELQDDHTEL